MDTKKFTFIGRSEMLRFVNPTLIGRVNIKHFISEMTNIFNDNILRF
jgi:hypothetical protein